MSGSMAGMGPGVTRIRQLKLPVSDLEVSARWYAALLGLENAAEFVEEDMLRGVVLADHETGFVIGLREREACASKPVLAGHDIVAFELAAKEDVEAFLARCDQLGVRHGEVQDRGEYGVAVDVVDPDGTVLRFVAGRFIGAPGEFLGVAFDAAGTPSRYDVPRLPVSGVAPEREGSVAAREVSMGNGRASVRPAIGTVGFMAGLVLVLFVLRESALAGRRTDGDFVKGQEFGVWLLVATASVLLWVAVLARGVGVLRKLVGRLKRERPVRKKEWVVHGAGVAAIGAAVLFVLERFGSEAPEVPVHHWDRIVQALLAVAGAAAVPWVIAVWMTHERLQAAKSRIESLTGPGATANAEIDELRTSWQLIERAVLFLLAIVLSATVMSGALRAALVPEELDESKFPASSVILYGAFFAFVSAIVVLPLVASWRSKASLLVDKVCPVTSTMTEEDAGKREKLGAALNLDVSMFRSPLTVLGVLSPLLTGVLAVFVPQLAK